MCDVVSIGHISTSRRFLEHLDSYFLEYSFHRWILGFENGLLCIKVYFFEVVVVCAIFVDICHANMSKLTKI